MMKRFLMVVFALVLTLAFMGCDNSSPSLGVFIVTFDANGGIMENGQPTKDVSVGQYTFAARPADPAKEGWDFINWFEHPTQGDTAWDFAASQITGNMTLYARWATRIVTVTFDASGGTSVPNQVLSSGENATAPTTTRTGIPTPATPGLFRDQWTLSGWTHNGTVWNFDDPVTESMTLTAQWAAPEAITDLPHVHDAANIIQRAFQFANDNPGTYILAINADHNFSVHFNVNFGTAQQPQTLPVGVLMGENTNITLIGLEGERFISLINPALMFLIQSNSQLTIGENITLRGPAGANRAPIVQVQGANSHFTMLENSKITRNNFTSFQHPLLGVGAAVSIGSNGAFTMKGGEITGNSTVDVSDWANASSGLWVSSGTTVNLQNGSITGNTGANDVFISTGSAHSFVTLAGNAVIGTLTVGGNGLWYGILIESGWTGGIGTVHFYSSFQGTPHPASMLVALAEHWVGRMFLRAAPGHSLSAADVERVTLGNLHVENAQWDFFWASMERFLICMEIVIDNSNTIFRGWIWTEDRHRYDCGCVVCFPPDGYCGECEWCMDDDRSRISPFGTTGAKCGELNLRAARGVEMQAVEFAPHGNRR